MRTKRQAFDTIKNHLLTQNAKSTENMSCVYRSTSGLKCAVGCLISDEKYSASLEGNDIETLIEKIGEDKVSDILDVSVDFDTYLMLEELQSMHDSYPPKNWESMLNDIEKVFFK